MRLSNYLQKSGHSYEDFAGLIGVTMTTVYRYAKGLRIPDENVMPVIHAVTNGEVTANDFYDLPEVKCGHKKPKTKKLKRPNN